MGPGRIRGAPADGLREAVPERYLLSRHLRAFGGVVEAARHRFPAGENAVSAIGGLAVSLHLSGPASLWQRWDGGRPREFVQRPGEMALVPPGVPFEQADSIVSEDLHVLLKGSFVSRTAEEAGPDPDRVEFANSAEVVDPQMERLMRSFLPELESGGLGGELYAQALATQLAVHLLRDHSSLGEKARRRVSRGPRPVGLSARALKRATDYIGDNLADPGGLSLERISAEANLSPSHFSKLFREAMGLAPYQYVVAQRIERAKTLLASTDLAVGEVARLAGFSHQSHLTRHFKLLTGTTPARFRREAGR